MRADELLEQRSDNFCSGGADADPSGILYHDGAGFESAFVEADGHLASAIVTDGKLCFVAVAGSFVGARYELGELEWGVLLLEHVHLSLDLVVSEELGVVVLDDLLKRLLLLLDLLFVWKVMQGFHRILDIRLLHFC